jgi:hypothetical protein
MLETAKDFKLVEVEVVFRRFGINQRAIWEDDEF